MLVLHQRASLNGGRKRKRRKPMCWWHTLWCCVIKNLKECICLISLLLPFAQKSDGGCFFHEASMLLLPMLDCCTSKFTAKISQCLLLWGKQPSQCLLHPCEKSCLACNMFSTCWKTYVQKSLTLSWSKVSQNTDTAKFANAVQYLYAKTSKMTLHPSACFKRFHEKQRSVPLFLPSNYSKWLY